MTTTTKDTWSDTAKLFRDIQAARSITLAVACREMIGKKNYTTVYYGDVHRWVRRGDTPPDKDRLRIEKWCEEWQPFLQLTKKK